MPDVVAQVPPHDLDAERELLGTVIPLLPAEAMGVLCLLDPPEFYTPAHRVVWDAARACVARSRNPGIIELRDELHARGRLDESGGLAYLTELAACGFGGPARARHLAEIVRDKARARAVIGLCADAMRTAYDTGRADPADLASRLLPMLAADAGATSTPIGQEMLRIVETLDQPPPPVYPSGLADLDSLIASSCAPGHYAIVAARPGQGKTTLAWNWARHQAGRSVPVLFVSLEMSGGQLATKALASDTAINSCRIRRRVCLSADERRRLSESMSRNLACPIQVLSAGRLDIAQLRAAVAEHRLRDDVRVVVIDYLTLLSCRAASRESYRLEVSAISRALKALAMEHEILVVCLAQLNRAPEKRTDRRPQISDLRESGSIEQDADVILLLHRDETEDAVVEIHVGKQREGPTGCVRVRYDRAVDRFQNLTEDPAPSLLSSVSVPVGPCPSDSSTPF